MNYHEWYIVTYSIDEMNSLEDFSRINSSTILGSTYDLWLFSQKGNVLCKYKKIGGRIWIRAGCGALRRSFWCLYLYCFWSSRSRHYCGVFRHRGGTASWDVEIWMICIDIDNSLVGQLTSARGIVEESLDIVVELLLGMLKYGWYRYRQ